jgi:acyl carrier protein
MSDDDIRAAVLAALGHIAPEVDLSTLDPEVSIRDQIDIDSFDFLNFIIGLSKATGVEIPEADYARLSTLNEAMSYLASELRGASRSG